METKKEKIILTIFYIFFAICIVLFIYYNYTNIKMYNKQNAIESTIELKYGEPYKINLNIKQGENNKITWTSSNPELVIVDDNGNVSIVNNYDGEVIITATTDDNQIIANVTIEVEKVDEIIHVTGVDINKNEINLKYGETSKIEVLISPDNATNKEVIWTSSNPSLVKIDNKGNITVVENKEGIATVTAKTIDGELTKSVTVSVQSIKVTGVKLNKKEITLKYGETTKLTATVSPTNAANKEITWTSSNPELVSIDSLGTISVNKNKNGEATITAKTEDGGYTASAKVTVKAVNNVKKVTGIKSNKSEITLKYGETSKIEVTITPSNATNKTITWINSDPSLISVDNKGNIKAIGNKDGTATITIKTTDGGYTTSIIVIVKSIKVSGIKLDKKEITLKHGESTKLNATISPSNAANKTITWTSSDSNLVSVDNKGNIKAIGNKDGTVTINAKTYDGNYTASAKVTVKAINTSTPSSSIATDRITFESFSSANAILLQSSNNFMLIDAGKDTGKGDESCTSLVNDIKDRIGNNHIKYSLISHLHIDHVGCLESILKSGVIIDNIIIKDYTNYTDDMELTARYNKLLQILKNNHVNIYQIYDKDYTLTTLSGHNFGFKQKKDEIKSTTCTNDDCVKKYNEDLSITVNLEDLNRSRINLSIGNYYLRLFNLPLRNDSDNLNSISVYGTIDGYNFYIANDLTNGGVNKNSIRYDSYGNTSTLLDAYRNKTMPGRLADYYAWFINKYFSKGPVDLYQAGHHGYSNGTTTYLANLLIDKNTKIVFTNSANQLYGSIKGWKSSSKGNLLIKSQYKKYTLCKALDDIDNAAYHRCLNDYTIARISNVLNKKGTTTTKIYHLSDPGEKPLTFGFNNSNASRITISGGEYITYDYDSTFNNYALYTG